MAPVDEPRSFNSRQLLFMELFVGTLIYKIVLGFFDDDASIVEATSFSYVFFVFFFVFFFVCFAAILLEVLTCLVLAVKDAIVGRLRHRGTRRALVLMVFSVWFVMFSSKLVFIEAIDLVFGDDVNIDGFVGVFAVAIVVTVAHRLADLVFTRLRTPTADGPIADTT